MATRRKLVALVFAVSLSCATAYAQHTPSTDPSADTPAGIQYVVPVDGARKDAAPHDKPSSGSRSGAQSRDDDGAAAPAGGGSGGTAPASALRSENGFGTSSTVPGDPAADAGGTRTRAGSGAGHSRAQAPAGKARAGGPRGRAAAGDASRTSGAERSAGAAADVRQATGAAIGTPPDPADSRAGLLLGLAALLGAGIGLGARRLRRR